MRNAPALRFSAIALGLLSLAVVTACADVTAPTSPAAPPTAVAPRFGISTSPDLTCSANITVSNQPGQGGAIVTYAPAIASGSVTISGSSPASGSFFPIGTTTVTVSALEFVGIISFQTCKFTVTVIDVEQPSIIAVANLAVASGSPSGTVVNYVAPIAADNSGSAPVTCVPPSGSVFPLGATTVTCTATDGSGNAASTSFVVTVTLDPVAAVTQLRGDVAGAPVPRNAINSLINSLTSAREALIAGKTGTACSALDSFVRHTLSARGNKIPASLADAWIARALSISAQIGCA